ncbi:hypothetical protein Y032_0089g2239 [Ancylostoma ceylanicum]|uniref:Protein kinase domain-containing protein n=1 Tax=Ancylostoma ceylanicum TaxID=53326 RepID=A0A016TNB1_9BILA|nr:hypothetical protein Y032_0089g2239 [Ancylostoma ceylanicum]
MLWWILGTPLPSGMCGSSISIQFLAELPPAGSPIEDLIGTGNFCKVFRGTYYRDKNDIVPVAIKICHGASVQTVTEEAKQARESMIHEAQLMSYYVHRHVIQLYGVACDHYPVMIVMEYCPGGNLQEHMQKYKQKVSTPERIVLSYEVCIIFSLWYRSLLGGVGCES